MAKRYYWLKLKEDFFRNREVKKLRKIAGGDTYTIVYLKLLLLSLKNDGKLFYEGIETNFASEMALEIDEDEENVALTVQYLLSCGILQKNTDVEYELLTTAELTGTESDSAQRMRKLRSRKAEQSHVLPSHSDGDVTMCDTEIEKSTEKSAEGERERGGLAPTEQTFEELRNLALRKVEVYRKKADA